MSFDVGSSDSIQVLHVWQEDGGSKAVSFSVLCVCVGGGVVEVIIWLREVCGTVSTLPL